MERFNFKYKNDIFVASLIILLVLLFLKAVFYYMSITNFHNIFLNLNNLLMLKN